MEFEKGNTCSLSLVSSPWKELWTCRKTEYSE